MRYGMDPLQMGLARLPCQGTVPPPSDPFPLQIWTCLIFHRGRPSLVANVQPTHDRPVQDVSCHGRAGI